MHYKAAFVVTHRPFKQVQVLGGKEKEDADDDDDDDDDDPQ